MKLEIISCARLFQFTHFDLSMSYLFYTSYARLPEDRNGPFWRGENYGGKYKFFSRLQQ